MRTLVSLILVVPILLLSACLEPSSSSDGSRKLGQAAETARAPESWVPEDVKWDTSGPYSRVLASGPYKALPVEITTFKAFDGTSIQTSVWRPDVPEGVKVPVIMDSGPYFGDQINQPLSNLARMIIEGILPHGFAYAQMAVPGTSASGGCQEFFSVREQKSINDAVTYYGTREWSNGNVALIGISYDGTTAWISATFGNPHLKTIVPISGLTSIYDHSFRNGTPWFTAPAIHAVYWTYGWESGANTPQDKVANTACPEGPRGVATAAYSTVTGARDEPPVFDGYWEEREFRPRILKNYNGSVFLVQGMRDWRVPPWLHFPFMQDLQDAGIETKMLLGQWWHDVPDRSSTGEHRRWDYAEMLLRWFDQSLNEHSTVNTGPLVEIEDDAGLWRTEADWPPYDVAWTPWYLSATSLRAQDGPAGEQVLFGPASAHRIVADRLPGSRSGPEVPILQYRATTGPLKEDLRFAGLPRLHVTFIPTSPAGARINAELHARSPEGAERDVGHAVMDLRYYQGGYQSHTLTPGQPILAKMEFIPLDAYVPAGHELVLVISGAGYSSERLTRGSSGYLDQWWESPTPLPVRIVWGDGKSTLQLPLIERDVGDGKYPGQP